MSALWWSWIAPISVQLLPLGILVALADRILARAVRAEWRAAVWALLFVKLVLPPSLQGAWVPTALLPEHVSQAYSGAEYAAAQGAAWVPAAFVLWLIVFIGILATCFVRLRHAARRFRAARPVDDATLLMAQRVAAQLGLRSLPPIQVSRATTGPVVLGILSPRILLPAELATNELGHILAHELSHVRRADPLRGFLLFVLHAAFWFHPVVWLAHCKVNLLREQCCDLEAARVTGSPQEYRHTLLSLTARLQGLQPVAGLGFFSSSRILSRLENLERAWDKARAPLPLHCWLLTLLLAACCLPAVSTQLPESWMPEVSLEEMDGCLPARMLVLRELAKAQAQPVR